VLEAMDRNGQPVPTGDLEDRRPRRLRLAKSAADINQELGRSADAAFHDVLLFRYSPNNEDFVYRKNRILGGSAGCMFNGMRGWIADNVFTNCRGTGVNAGYHSPNEASGYGARDVLVKGNTMINCGGSAVEVRSTANVGGNILIRQNHSTHRRIENGFFWTSVFIKNDCDAVEVKDNVFESDLPPEWNSWIVSKDNRNGVKQSGNQTLSPFTVPLLLESKTNK
jgi:hypothetical protein